MKTGLVAVGAALTLSGLALLAAASLTVVDGSFGMIDVWGFPVLLSGVTVLVVERATREVVTVRCRNCGSLMDAGASNCPTCSAPV